MQITITFDDSRFDDLNMSSEERLEALRTMIEERSLDLSDEFVTGLVITSNA